MNENDNNNSQHSEGIEEPEKKSKRARPTKKTQSQALQEALGIKPEDLNGIEGKLSVIKFLDYFSQEPLDFAFKERNVDQYIKRITERVDNFDTTNEEDKLLKIGFEDKKILEAVQRIKTKTEEVTISKGVNKSVEKKLRNVNLMITAPLLVVALLFFILPIYGIPIDSYFMLPILCVFCMVPQFVRNSAAKKWYRFKEENRNEVYTKNR
ncbi:unnamed protein product, partial [marine sediment metagenome]